ncbi:oxidoreductase [Nostoc sp. 3335mG]|nr:oxidoreductase [Nostoc sp. 3335mG]
MPRGRLTTALAAPLRLLLVALSLLISPAHALDPLPAPTGPVLLTVNGNVTVTNSPNGAEFDREMLYALGLEEVRTTTAWTDGIQVFEGVLLKSVLDRVGARGTVITATAINEYVAPIPMEDPEKYRVLLAAKMNGVEMTVRDRGPLWVVYPREDHAELLEPHRNDRWVWQVRELNVQ